MKVYANGILLSGTENNGTYSYTISNIESNQTITVTGVELDKHTVTYIVDGQVYTTAQADYGSYLTEPVSPKNNGKTFKGWNGANGIWNFATDRITEDITLTAVWDSSILTVTPAQNGTGYTVDSIDSTNVIYGGSYTFTVSIAEHYNAKNMKVYSNGVLLSGTENGGVYTFVVSDIAADQVITVTGVELDKHTVTYIVDGQVYTTAQADYGSYLAEPVSPKNNGKTFKGWSSANGIWNFAADRITEDITLNAVWDSSVLTITPAQSGTGYTVDSIDSTNVVYGGSYRFTITIAEHYNAKNMKVYANGILLSGKESNGTYSYTISNIESSQTITVTGVELDKHTVTYIVDGQVYTTAQADYGSYLTEPVSPKNNGKTFKGWNGAHGIWNFATDKITEDITLNAVWDSSILTVTPAKSGTGYTVDSTDSANVVYGGSYTFTVSIAEHYNAKNMKVYANGILLSGKESNGTYSYTISNIESSQTITVTGVELDKHTVTYIVDGQVYTTAQADYGSYLTEPVSPKNNGKTFKGWNGANGIWNFATDRITEDITLTAVWDSSVLTITPAQDGTGYTVDSNDSTNVVYGGSYTFTVSIAEHYNAKNMKVYANGVLLTPTVYDGKYEFTVKNITDDITIIVSNVSADIYTVNYNVDNELHYSEKVVYNGKAQKPRTPEKTGYAFVGWFNGDTEWNFADGIENDLELNARFEKLVYRITVPENNNEFSVSVLSENPVEYGGNFEFVITVSDGHSTSDMMVYANGVLIEKTSESGNTVYFNISNITEPKVITVRGIGQNTYAVTYNANTSDYVGNIPEIAIKVYGSDMSISDLIPERYGYNFVGWAVEKNGTAKYFAGDIYSENSDVKLYAVWEAMVFSVDFESNGGRINSGEIMDYTYGIGAALPNDVSKTGYDFAGWYEDELLRGVKTDRIRENDYGNKKYYAAYTMASVKVNGYNGEYDGNDHNITYTLPGNLPVEKYQWYFVPDGSSEAVPVPSVLYNMYPVRNTAQNGEYYCYIEALDNGYVIRFFTERTTVKIDKKLVSVKAASSSKIYDAKPLFADGAELVNQSSLADNHKMSVIMTAQSTITNAGTKDNEIESIIIYDGENSDVTENYNIEKLSGLLSVTPRELSVSSKSVVVSVGAVLSENQLYDVSGMLGGEKLYITNISVSAKNENGADIPFRDITKSAGTYNVTVNYSGFGGEGCENYQGNGSFTSVVTVYKSSGGGSNSGGSGGGGETQKFTVKFDTAGGSTIKDQSVKAGGTTKEPEAPKMDGYIFDGWYNSENLTEQFDFANKITQNITLYAKWLEVKKDEEPDDENSSSANPEKTGVANILETKKHIAYLSGNGDGKFRPKNNMTRAEVAQMFYNLLLKADNTGRETFSDVIGGSWYFDAVTTLADMGIINGYSDGTFRPDGYITRAEFVAIAMRFVSVSVNGTKTFTDVAHNHWAAKDISDAASLGWISGNNDGTFEPDVSIQRAAVVKIVNNMLGRKADSEYINAHKDIMRLFDDVLPTAWYYGDIVEATNAHEYEKNNTETWK